MTLNKVTNSSNTLDVRIVGRDVEGAVPISVQSLKSEFTQIKDQFDADVANANGRLNKSKQLDLPPKTSIYNAFSFDLDDSKYVFPKPTLVLLGRYDTEVGYMDSVKAIEIYPRATYVILDKAGHSLAWEQPSLLRALVVDWVARVEEYVE